MRRGLVAGVLLAGVAGCGGSPPPPLPEATPAALRAQRRAYEGAPPVVPHPRFSRDCGSCHETGGVAVPGVGVAPASPHAETRGVGSGARCGQCHVERTTGGEFRLSHFEGRRPTLRHRPAAFPGGPPVIPHPVFMRESCAACHVGSAARPEIHTTHAERTRCRQCHVERPSAASFGASG